MPTEPQPFNPATITPADIEQAKQMVRNMKAPGTMIDGKKLVPVAAAVLKRLWEAKDTQ